MFYFSNFSREMFVCLEPFLGCILNIYFRDLELQAWSHMWVFYLSNVTLAEGNLNDSYFKM